MKKLVLKEKKNLSGGFSPTVLWIAVAGVCMMGNMIFNGVSGLADSLNGNENKSKSNNNYSYGKKTSYVRFSPFIRSSAISMRF